MADAKQKADRLRQEAEDYAKELLNKDAITRGAEQKAADMIAEAEVQCQQLKEAASEYCEETCAAWRRPWPTPMTRSSTPALSSARL